MIFMCNLYNCCIKFKLADGKRQKDKKIKINNNNNKQGNTKGIVKEFLFYCDNFYACISIPNLRLKRNVVVVVLLVPILCIDSNKKETAVQSQKLRMEG